MPLAASFPLPTYKPMNEQMLPQHRPSTPASQTQDDSWINLPFQRCDGHCAPSKPLPCWRVVCFPMHPLQVLSCLGCLRTLLLVQGILQLEFLSGAEDFPAYYYFFWGGACKQEHQRTCFVSLTNAIKLAYIVFFLTFDLDRGRFIAVLMNGNSISPSYYNPITLDKLQHKSLPCLQVESCHIGG